MLIEYSRKNINFPVETSLEEIKTIVTEKNVIEYQDDLILMALFDVQEYLDFAAGIKMIEFLIENFFPSLYLLIETLIKKIKRVLT